MKRIKLFLTVCLGLSVFQTVFADDVDTARAAKRGAVGTISTSNSGTRGTGTSAQKTEQNRSENARSTTTKNVRSSPSVQSRTTTKSQPIIKQRSATQTSQKNVITRPQVAPRTNTVARTATTRKSTTHKTQKTNTTRVAISPIKSNRTARATTLNDAKINEIKSKNYSQCKTVYQECMDEFCANKDTTLRRCACSTRIHEFDNIKKQLSTAEEQMVQFNQRLVTVGLDKEDALAINVATEGETAFAKTDSSESEKLLQKITDTLNSSGDSKITNNLAAVSLDLNMDSAWDSVDALSGISTTAKSGLDLYNAAQPVCLEMAKEVCSNDELDIVTNSYKLSIQNDCDTVARAYNTQYNTAMGKIHESGALLDMARLNAYQQRNSDDILTCKQKILNQLSDASVCGEKLYKCLDITGKYIDPSTGAAVLSNDLYNLSTLLTPPQNGDTKWSKVGNNDQFVKFLNSKKMFLDTATKQCQDLADDIWSDFIEDALAQIKLAQNAKMEEIRRSCLTLITECKNTALTSIENFDINAISTFQNLADSTATGMCADVQNACMGLINHSVDGDTYAEGISGVMTDASYEKVLENCMLVGKNCIMQHCNGLSGNFSLCQERSQPVRQSILSRRTCWQDVYDCVKQAESNLPDIEIADTGYLYCYDDEQHPKVCKIAHKIWGNCDFPVLPSESWFTNNTTDEYNPQICTESNNKPDCEGDYNLASLLYWFGHKTNKDDDSGFDCQVSSCPIGYAYDLRCEACSEDIGGGTPKSSTFEIVPNGVRNTCLRYGCGAKDKRENCCQSQITFPDSLDDEEEKICVQSKSWSAILVQTVQCPSSITNPPTTAEDIALHYVCGGRADTKISLYCLTTQPDTFPRMTDSGTVECGDNINTGKWILVDDFGNYFYPLKECSSSPAQCQSIYTWENDGDTIGSPMSYYINQTYCSVQFSGTHWQVTPSSCSYNPFNQENVHVTIKY